VGPAHGEKTGRVLTVLGICVYACVCICVCAFANEYVCD
jgi:hypothetical protein